MQAAVPVLSAAAALEGVRHPTRQQQRGLTSTADREEHVECAAAPPPTGTETLTSWVPAWNTQRQVDVTRSKQPTKPTENSCWLPKL
jgi:hypothetical protein